MHWFVLERVASSNHSPRKITVCAPGKNLGQAEKFGYSDPGWLLEVFMGGCEDLVVVSYSRQFYDQCCILYVYSLLASIRS